MCCSYSGRFLVGFQVGVDDETMTRRMDVDVEG
jgi:hypothetical protein